MRRFLALASLALALGALGCSTPCASTGWSFSIGKPATMYAPAAIAQGSPGLALYPVTVAASAAVSHPMAFADVAPPCSPCPPCPPAAPVTLPSPKPLP